MSINQQPLENEKERAPQETRADVFHLGHRRNLDGLRGVAVLMVVFSHLYILNQTSGTMGVEIFFVLSGFLITTLLLEEWSQTKKISLRAFYLRRALRLLPALYVMLGLVLAYAACFHTRRDFSLDWKSARSAFFYYANWMQAYQYYTPGWLRHMWTLSIEEQFYIFWPWVLLLMLKWCPRNSMSNLVFFAASLACFNRIYLFAGTAASPMRLQRGSDTQADAFLIGCAIGVFLFARQIPAGQRFVSVLNWGCFISVIGLWGMSNLSFWRFYEVMITIGLLLMSLFIGVILLKLVIAPGFFSRLALENRLIVYVGKVSYGLYLWHVPVIDYLKSHCAIAFDWKFNVLAFSLSAIAAVCSFHLIEKPFLHFKKRFQVVS